MKIEQAVSDAAWEAIKGRTMLDRDYHERANTSSGLVLRTREEWDGHIAPIGTQGMNRCLDEIEKRDAELAALRDKYAAVVDQLTDLREGDKDAEIAALREQIKQLHESDAYLTSEWERDNAGNRARITELEAELDRLRQENDFLRALQDSAGELQRKLQPFIDGEKRSRALLITPNVLDHHLGRAGGER